MKVNLQRLQQSEIYKPIGRACELRTARIRIRFQGFETRSHSSIGPAMPHSGLNVTKILGNSFEIFRSDYYHFVRLHLHMGGPIYVF